MDAEPTNRGGHAVLAATVLGLAAGLSVRNDDRLRWLAVVAFVLVAGFAFFAGAPFLVQATLALLAYPVAVLRPSVLVHR